jgi:hypothetical protein
VAAQQGVRHIGTLVSGAGLAASGKRNMSGETLLYIVLVLGLFALMLSFPH